MFLLWLFEAHTHFQMTWFQGVVQFYLPAKGYGYIRIPDTREEFYVHRKDLRAPIRTGQTVIFSIAETRHGLQAIEVRPAEP